MKQIFSSFLLSLLIFTACGKIEDDKSDKDKKTDEMNKTDLSSMPLKRAIQTKYETFEMVCDYSAELTRENISGDLEVSKSEESFMLWDLINDFEDSKFIDFSKTFKDVVTRVQWDLTPHFLDQLNLESNDKSGVILHTLTDTVVLKGTNKTQITQFTESGDVGVKIEGGASDDSLYERVPTYAINTKMGGTKNRTRVTLECQMAAKAKKGFEKDFQTKRL